MTRVVNVRKERCEIYIGRAAMVPMMDAFNAGLRVRHPSSLFANPFRVEAFGRLDAIEKYCGWLRDQPRLIDAARASLRGRILGCWCAPLQCHGHILALIVEWPERKDLDKLLSRPFDLPFNIFDEISVANAIARRAAAA